MGSLSCSLSTCGLYTNKNGWCGGFRPCQVLIPPDNASYSAWGQLKHRPTGQTDLMHTALADDKCVWQATLLCESFRADCWAPKGPISSLKWQLSPKAKSVWHFLSRDDIIHVSRTGSSSAFFWYCRTLHQTTVSATFWLSPLGILGILIFYYYVHYMEKPCGHTNITPIYEHLIPKP